MDYNEGRDSDKGRGIWTCKKEMALMEIVNQG